MSTEKKAKANQEQINAKETEELEKLEILAKADEIKSLTLGFDFSGQLAIEDEVKNLMLSPIDNPEERYDLYYNVLNKLLQDHLPKGDEYKKARDYIYEEKNTFLTGGHRKGINGKRGADGRMAYIPNLHELINIVIKWVAANGTMLDLFNAIREKNIELGYGKSEIEK